jgi:hypothetical protein
MSALRLFAPAELQLFPRDEVSPPGLSPALGDDDGAVLPFPTLRRTANGVRTGTASRMVTGHSMARNSWDSAAAQTPLDRARLLHTHRCCPDCGRGGTVPREAAGIQAVCLSMPVPGTSTLLGFGCHNCGHEWSV